MVAELRLILMKKVRWNSKVNTVCYEFGLKANAFHEAKDRLGEEIKNSEVVGKNSCKSKTLMTPRARARAETETEAEIC